MGLRPVGLAYVLFEEGDIIGHLLAYISISHLFVIGGIVGVMLVTFDSYFIYTFICMLCNEIINYVIKVIVNDPRPELSHNINKGFPSSHAQFFCCFFVMMIHYINTMKRLTPKSKNILYIGMILYVILVDISRWYLNDHFIYQIVCGNILGLIIGFVCVKMYNTFEGYYQNIKEKVEKILIDTGCLTN